MRSAASLLGLLIVAAIAGLIYKYYFSQRPESAAVANPVQTIDVVGVKNDLIGIAQAERMYQAQNGSYGSLDELASSGAMTIKKSGRDGYTYEAEVSPDGFRIVAHCPSATIPGCTSYAVDQTMEVQPAP
ncbi:MAG TPA: hypothetical protein VEJ46_12580 [Candidatus Acidoferrum sp.]|nr:hypothetical protein [Candidatus Acidoferrum sp.]